MKAAFIHDHNFYFNTKNNTVYDGSGGVFDENLWRRYLRIFDELIVVGRRTKEVPNRLVKSTAKNVVFELNEDLTSGISRYSKRNKVKSNLTKTLNKVDFAIIRLPSVLGRVAQKICIEKNIQYVIEVVGDPFQGYWYHGSLSGKVIAPIEACSLRRSAKKAANAIYVTNKMLQEKYPCPNRSIGISNVKLDETVSKDSIVDFYNNPSDKFTLGLIGSFHIKYKGHVEAIKAIKHLKNKGYTNLRLNLVGTGDPSWVNAIVIDEELTEEIKIIGALKAGTDGILPFLDNLDLYIHPSKQEGLPRVIIEAMSRGKLCLGSDAGGTRELLPDQFIHTAGDWKNLSKQIEYLINIQAANRIDLAVNNLMQSKNYMESVLQNKREEFINNIL